MVAAHGEQHQLLRILHGQQAQQNLIEQGEYRGIGADAQRQGQYRDRGKHRILRQHARGIPDVSDQSTHR